MSDSETAAEAMRPVLERLDDIAASLRRIADCLEGGVQAPAPRATGRSAAAAPVSKAAEAGEGGAVAAAATAAAKAAKPGPSRRVNTDEAETPDTPEIRDVRPVLTAMFSAAMLEDKEETWLELQALTHPDELSAPRALAGFIGFSWAKLRRNIGLYLDAIDEPGSFRVARTVPTELRPNEDRIKVFLLRDDEMQVPVALRRDGVAEGAWRLSSISL
ncbi:MAG: hypothetical protein R3F39_25190 [Myxococcota bacterium]